MRGMHGSYAPPVVTGSPTVGVAPASRPQILESSASL
jgi:hypothetical protein